MTYSLPEALPVNGTQYRINSDYRVALEIMEMFDDPELSNGEKAQLMIEHLYPDAEQIPAQDYGEAAKQAAWFLDGGIEHSDRKGPKVMDWAQDFPYIVAPVNRVIGQDVRGMAYCHWWTFLAAWQEIGDCYFAQLVNIRNKKARGKKLDKAEQEFLRRNRDAITLKRTYTTAEEAAISKWI